MRGTITWGVVSVLLLAASCSSGASTQTAQSPQTSQPAQTSPPVQTTPTPSTTATTSDYHPVIDPKKFTSHVTNSYFPLKPGNTLIYDGTRDGKPTHTEMAVTRQTRTIMGITCVVIRDVVTSNGALVEKTTDWYAQAADGAVWYFGEATAEYVNGQISNTHGSWEGGVDGAQPGIIMEAAPKAGDVYKQEFRPGIAEDTARVLKTDGTLKVGGKTYPKLVVTEDTNPLAPDKRDQKNYAPGIGLLHTIRESTGHHEVMAYTTTRTG